jgi:hypothetical protein
MSNNQKLVPLFEKGYVIDCDYLIFVKNYHTFEEVHNIMIIDGGNL